MPTAAPGDAAVTLDAVFPGCFIDRVLGVGATPLGAAFGVALRALVSGAAGVEAAAVVVAAAQCGDALRSAVAAPPLVAATGDAANAGRRRADATSVAFSHFGLVVRAPAALLPSYALQAPAPGLAPAAAIAIRLTQLAALANTNVSMTTPPLDAAVTVASAWAAVALGVAGVRVPCTMGLCGAALLGISVGPAVGAAERVFALAAAATPAAPAPASAPVAGSWWVGALAVAALAGFAGLAALARRPRKRPLDSGVAPRLRSPRNAPREGGGDLSAHFTSNPLRGAALDVIAATPQRGAPEAPTPARPFTALLAAPPATPQPRGTPPPHSPAPHVDDVRALFGASWSIRQGAADGAYFFYDAAACASSWTAPTPLVALEPGARVALCHDTGSVYFVTARGATFDPPLLCETGP